MSDTRSLAERIEDALARTASGPSPGWKGSEEESIRRKADDALAAIARRGWDVGRTAFLDVGGADGALVEYLLNNTASPGGVVLEYDDDAGQAAIARSARFAGGKKMQVLVGDANQKISRAIDHLSQWRDDGRVDQMCVTLFAVLHELSDRGGGTNDLVEFLSRLVWRLPAVVVAREPCVPPDLPSEVFLSIPQCPPKLITQLAERIRAAHPAAFPREPQTLTNRVRLDGRLAVETITKIFYVDDLEYELEERVTSLTSAEMVNSFYHVFGGANVQHENLQSVSFDEKWSELDLRLTDADGRELPKPQLHVKLTAYHAASDEPARQVPLKERPATAEDAHAARGQTALKGTDPSDAASLDLITRMHGDLAASGVSYVFPHREEETQSGTNAVTRLREAFRAHDKGTVRMMGVTLRVFFNPPGAFFSAIEGLVQRENGVSLQALISHPESPEAEARARIEEPDLGEQVTSELVRNLESTITAVRKMRRERPCIELRNFREAPYCTVVLFPNEAYFSPNILAPNAPVRLPMIVFGADSHGYRMLQASFDYLWENSSPVVPDQHDNEPVQPVTDVIRGKLRRTEFVVQEARKLAEDGEASTLRMWQGFGPLSLEDDEHLEDQEYSDLLSEERKSVIKAIHAGCETLIIVTRRPFYGRSPEGAVGDGRTARRLHRRCSNLIRVVEECLARPGSARLLLAYSDEPHFSEYCFGDQVVIRGMQPDAQSSYEHSLVLRDRDEVAEFIRKFDERMDRLTGGAASSGDQRRARRATQKTIRKLRELESELAEWVRDTDVT